MRRLISLGSNWARAPKPLGASSLQIDALMASFRASYLQRKRPIFNACFHSQILAGRTLRDFRCLYIIERVLNCPLKRAWHYFKPRYDYSLPKMNLLWTCKAPDKAFFSSHQNACLECVFSQLLPDLEQCTKLTFWILSGSSTFQNIQFTWDRHAYTDISRPRPQGLSFLGTQKQYIDFYQEKSAALMSIWGFGLALRISIKRSSSCSHVTIVFLACPATLLGLMQERPKRIAHFLSLSDLKKAEIAAISSDKVLIK